MSKSASFVNLNAALTLATNPVFVSFNFGFKTQFQRQANFARNFLSRFQIFAPFQHLMFISVSCLDFISAAMFTIKMAPKFEFLMDS